MYKARDLLTTLQYFQVMLYRLSCIHKRWSRTGFPSVVGQAYIGAREVGRSRRQEAGKIIRIYLPEKAARGKKKMG